MRHMSLLVGCWLVLVSALHAEVKSKEITYKDGNVECRGYLAWDDAVAGARPGVLVVHEWWGLNDYARERAQMLAKEGYIAFACDMYGEGKQAAHPIVAGEIDFFFGWFLERLLLLV